MQVHNDNMTYNKPHFTISNNDIGVNILDLVLVAYAIVEAETDLNGHVVANIQDLVIIANALGNTTSSQ